MVAEKHKIIVPPANGDTSSGRNSYMIDLNTFSRRLKALYKHWHQYKNDYWGSADVLAVATPPPTEDFRYLKSSALHIWLLGYEFPETIMVFQEKHIHFLCSQKKATLLEVVKKSAKENVGVDVVIHVKAKSDSGSNQIDLMLHDIRLLAGSKDVAPTVGYIAREVPEGKLLELWADKLKDSNLPLSDITYGFSDLLAVKDQKEISYIKHAAFLTARAMQKVVSKVENVIDEETKVTHSMLMNDTEKAILDPVNKIGVDLKSLKAENVDICYPPIFQSGGNFDLRPSASSNDDYLYYDSCSVIICAIGARYNSYCSNVARTYLINPNAEQRRAYEALLKAQKAAISAMKPGTMISSIYEAAIAVVKRETPEWVSKLTKSVGTGIGLEFRESGLIITSKNERVLKAGMVFNISLGFQNLQTKTSNEKSRNFSMLLADTVLVTDDGCVVATSACLKDFDDVASFFSMEDEAELPKTKVGTVDRVNEFSKATLRSDKGEISKEELRKQHQAKLARQKNEETARRLTGVGSAAEDGRSATKTTSELIAYKTVNELPPHREMMIRIDQKHEAILLPIYGNMVPFHISTVKTVSSQQDITRNSYIRIIFNVPGTTPPNSNSLKNEGVVYLKEVSFRSKDPRHASEVVQLIKTLRRNVMARESERAERATLVSQGRLVLASQANKIRLSNLWIRPTFGGRGKKFQGTLEAHVNGLRYSASKTDGHVVIMYVNIKHAFFQPAEKEMTTLIHFHLHNHIMVGTRKTKDVQFYVEVMETVQSSGGGKRCAYDPDEIEEEQREIERKNKINMEFQEFVDRVNDLWGQSQFNALDLKFDEPRRKRGFHGVPHKATAFIVPTSSCLVELIETPFVVISLSEIEIVNLERVGLAQKNFDMSIVFKDFKRDVFRIDCIPSSSIDGIKQWLDKKNIKYYESRLNLNWRPILKTITDDPQQFIETGGWEFLNVEAATDSDSDKSVESDQGYEPSDVEPESDSEDDDSDSESLVGSEEDSDENSEEDSEEDKGKTWEELEKEASHADREMGNESDSEDERRRRKMKASGKSRAPPPSGFASKRTKFR